MNEKKVKELIEAALVQERERIANAIMRVEMTFGGGEPDFDQFAREIAEAVRYGGLE